LTLTNRCELKKISLFFNTQGAYNKLANYAATIKKEYEIHNSFSSWHTLLDIGNREKTTAGAPQSELSAAHIRHRPKSTN